MNRPIHVRDVSGRDRLVRAVPELTLTQALFLEGLLPGRPFCAGLGRCGLCRVRYVSAPPDPSLEDQTALSPEKLDRGWRLACRRAARPGLDIELANEFPDADIPGWQPAFARPPRGRLSLAVDIGTTSLHWELRDESGMLDHGQDLNPQLAAGSEVMSRLGFALQGPENAHVLRKVVLDWLHPLAMAWPKPVDWTCVAGNSVMTAILLDWPLEGLAFAPYTLPHAGGFWTRLAPGWPEVYIPPLAAPFIGADLTAGLAHVCLGEQVEHPFLLADMGTNGEFILALGPEDFLAASVPLGPALEGIGMSCGSAALPGVWADFTLSAPGLSPVALPGEGGPDLSAHPRISGTGYLALLSCLRRLGLMDETGRFTPAGSSPLARRIGQALDTSDREQRLHLGRGASLTSRDVEELLKVKAAFNLAFSRLLSEAGLAPSRLKAVFLAGALGEHVRLEALEELGFVPLGMQSRIHALGNASLAGAAVLARNEQARQWIETASTRIRTLAIGQEADFSSQYMQRLVFIHVP